MATLRRGIYWDAYYGSEYYESEPLTVPQMRVNAGYIYNVLTTYFGWSVNSVAALLGNMQAESTINPGRWQSDDVENMSGGYGLVQWTPATKYFEWVPEFIVPDDPSHMDNNLDMINFEVTNGLQWISTDAYPLTFYEFTVSEESPEYLAKAFLLNYERPADQSESVQNYRAALANSWYAYITGGYFPDPGEPDIPSGDTKKKKKKYNFVLFNERRRKQWTNRHF